MTIFELPYTLWYYFQWIGVLSVLAWIALFVLSVRYARRNGNTRIYFGVATLVTLVYMLVLVLESSYALFVVAWLVLAAMLLIFAISRQMTTCVILALAVLSIFLAGLNSDAVSALRSKPSEVELKSRATQRTKAEQQRSSLAKRPGDEINWSDEESNSEQGLAEKGDSADASKDEQDPEKDVTAESKPKSATPTTPPKQNESVPFYKQRGKVNRDAEKASGGDQQQAQDFETGIEELGREMEEEDVYRAQTWDRINLFIVRSIFLITVVFSVADYLCRFNLTFDRVLPFPIAGRFVDFLSAKTHAVYAYNKDEDFVRRYLERAVAKGETFIYFGVEDLWQNRSLPQLKLFGKTMRSMSTMCISDKEEIPTSEFLLESAWFNRYAFVVLGQGTVQPLLQDLVKYLRVRTLPRAATRRAVNVVWDFPDPPTDTVLEQLMFLSRRTNFKLLIISSSAPEGDVLNWVDEVAEIDEDARVRQIPVPN